MPLILKPRSHDDLKEAIAALYNIRARDVTIDVFSAGGEDKLHIGLTVKFPKGLGTMLERPRG